MAAIGCIQILDRKRHTSHGSCEGASKASQYAGGCTSVTLAAFKSKGLGERLADPETLEAVRRVFEPLRTE